MGILKDLLKAATGEASLHSRLGLWRQKVSEQLDAFVAGAQYIQAKNAGEQAGVTQDSTIAVETDINARGITRPDAFAFQLTPGKTYHLIAHGRFTDFSDAAAGVLALQWVDDSNTAIPAVTAPSSRHRPMTSTVTSSEDSVTEAIYTVPASPASASRVKVRCVAGTGTATLVANGMSASIVEIR